MNAQSNDQNAERGALSCLLNDLQKSMQIATENGISTQSFYNPDHAALFGELLRVSQSGGEADPVSLATFMGSRGWTMAQLTELWVECPIIGGFAGWCHTLQKGEQWRGLNAALNAAQSDLGGDIDTALESLRDDVERLQKGKVQKIRQQTVRELLDFNQAADPDWLLGKNRWLCKGGSLMIAGSTGIGKSSLNMQLAICWAMWDQLDEIALQTLAFNIPARRALSSLIIQAENDLGDMADTLRGVLKHEMVASQMTSAKEQLLGQRLTIIRENETSGAEFLVIVRGHIHRYKPDIVWIDPIMNYIGGDMSDQETASSFCHALNRISNETGVLFVLINHVPKPVKDAKPGAYSSYGSSAWANWARDVLTVDRVEAEEGAPPTFRLAATKRRTRAGMMNWEPPHKDAAEIFIRHAKVPRLEGNYWAQTGPPKIDADAKGKKEKAK
jgi:hypothetical protein